MEDERRRRVAHAEADVDRPERGALVEVVARERLAPGGVGEHEADGDAQGGHEAASHVVLNGDYRRTVMPFRAARPAPGPRPAGRTGPCRPSGGSAARPGPRGRGHG